MEPRDLPTTYPGAITASDREVRADHEAGHFLAFHLLEITGIPHCVTLEPGACSETGHPTDGANCIDFNGDVDPTAWGIYLVAGMAATRTGLLLRYGKNVARRAEKIVQSGGQGDLLEFPKVRGTTKAWTYYMRKAHGLLRPHRNLVEALSSELQANQTLFHEEAWLVLKSARIGSSVIPRILEIYRRDRRPADLALIPKKFRDQYPALAWPETFKTWKEREGCRDLDHFEAWYAQKTGVNMDPLPLPHVSPKALALALVGEAVDRLKAKAKSFPGSVSPGGDGPTR